MTTYDASAAALKPLMGMYWSPRGWRDPPVPPGPAELARAVADGVMFSQPRSDTPAGWLAAARRAAAAVSAAEVGDAFLEGLGRRRLDLRSALGSYVVAVASPEVGPGAGPAQPEDLNVLNFERFKWGGVRHDDIAYVAFDLEQFARAPRDGATEADRELGREVIGAVRALPPRAGMTHAVRALRLLKGNDAERGVVAEILAACGIWRTPAWSSRYSGDADPVAEFLPGLDH